MIWIYFFLKIIKICWIITVFLGDNLKPKNSGPIEGIPSTVVLSGLCGNVNKIYIILDSFKYKIPKKNVFYIIAGISPRNKVLLLKFLWN